MSQGIKQKDIEKCYYANLQLFRSIVKKITGMRLF